jgi:hypothetical protein
MRGHIEELSDAEGGDYKVRASRILDKAPDSSAPASHALNQNETGIKIIFKLSNGHSKKDLGQDPALKPRPRIIIKRPQRPVELEEDAEIREPSPQSFLDEEPPRKSKKHGKKRHRKPDFVDDSDDEDFLPDKETKKKKSRDVSSKSRDFLAVSTPVLPNLVVEKIDLLGDEATNENLQEDGREAEAVSLNRAVIDQRADDNPITKTLQKCHRIAASLKSELKACSSSEDAINVDRYAEVDASAAKIVSQVRQEENVSLKVAPLSNLDMLIWS